MGACCNKEYEEEMTYNLDFHPVTDSDNVIEDVIMSFTNKYTLDNYLKLSRNVESSLVETEATININA